MVVITTKKPFEEVLESLSGLKKLVIVACGNCSAKCQTGGTEETKEMAEKLTKVGFEILSTIVMEEPCDIRITRVDLRRIEDSVKEAEAILALSCGLGAQAITEVLMENSPHIPVFVSTNTEFMGMTERIGRFYMRCRGCGDCLLNETGGICPLTTCAKSMLNGPCGGQKEGKCEVGNYENPCGWIQIYERLKQLGKLELYGKLRTPLSWKEIGHQRSVVWR